MGSAVLLGTLLAGCPMPVTGLPDGIYTGDTSVTVSITVEADSDETTVVRPKTLVIGAGGLPQWTVDGLPPEIGLVTENTVGSVSVRNTVTGVSVSRDRVFVTFDTSGTVLNGIRVFGDGSETYTFSPPNAIDIVFEVVLANSDSTDFVRVRREQRGTLVK